MTLPLIASDIIALGETLLIDLSLAGDNAILIAMIVRNMRGTQRRQAIAFGALTGGFLRCCLALIVVKLLVFPAISLTAGLLLAWVCFSLYHNLLHPPADEGVPPAQGKYEAILKIVIADLAMSLDNVLAIAGATASHPAIMTGGIALGVFFIIFLSAGIARLLDEHKWLAWCGLAIIAFVAAQLLWRGIHELGVQF